MKNLLLSFFILFTISCTNNQTDKNLYRIETNFGDITIKLYNKTPLHRDNFEKLVTENFFEDILFHRVINNFMIQGGDPDSKNAKFGDFLGEADCGYNIPAEFNDSLFHKKGVIAAAREGDKINPKKESSGSQFYIVQGKVFTDNQLDSLEISINKNIKESLYKKYFSIEENKAFDKGEDINYESIITIVKVKVKQDIDSIGKYKIPEFKRKYYRTIGGTPHLDGNYTVFGEIINGLEIVDKIASVKTDKNDRPIVDIKMKITKIK